jgi:energy-converting hydrogenase Eha subunit E
LNIIPYFLLFLFDWRDLALFMIVFIALLEAIDPKRFKPFFNGIEWNIKNVGVSLLFLAAIFIRTYFSFSSLPPEAVIPIVQIILTLVYTHVRSFMFYSALIYWLWYKWNSLVPAIYAGWFAIAIIEMTYLVQHLIAFKAFMGWEWYIPFFAVMIPVIYDRKRYSVQWKPWIQVFSAGVFLQYFLLIWQGQAFTTFMNGQLINNLDKIANPTLETWFHELIDHAAKSLLTFSFVYMRYKHD